MYISRYIKSSDSFKTVNVLAAHPANERKNDVNASYPVLPFLAVVTIVGTLVTSKSTIYEDATMSQWYSVIIVASNKK